MLQQCLSASRCMWMHTVMGEHYTYSGCQHSTPFVLNGPAQLFSFAHAYTSDIIVVPCCIISTFSTPFLSYKIVAISFLVNVCLHFLTCLVSMSASTVLTALWFQCSQMKCTRRFHHHICSIALKLSTKAKAIVCVFCATMSIFGTHLAQNLWW
jgi:hypothetical protein